MLPAPLPLVELLRMYLYTHSHTHTNTYAAVFLLRLFDTLFLIPLNLPAVQTKSAFASRAWHVAGDGSGSKCLDQSPGGGLPVALVG